MIVEFAVTAGPHVGRTFRFADHATFLVGRSPQAHFSLPQKDPYVSRLHLLVEVNPPLCRARDMGGVNGTVVNGVRVAEADLKDGDRITIGQTELLVRVCPTDPGDADRTRALPAGDPLAAIRAAAAADPTRAAEMAAGDLARRW